MNKSRISSYHSTSITDDKGNICQMNVRVDGNAYDNIIKRGFPNHSVDKNIQHIPVGSNLTVNAECRIDGVNHYLQSYHVQSMK